MSGLTKFIAGLAALLTAVGTLIATLGFGGDDAGYKYQTIILNSPEAYEAFLENHPG
tara:strand:+ start:707 stop:877 length:171 start_codon:yes stop_codon:yes gene_type:complete